MDNDSRNNYVGTEIHWISAQRIDGGEWKIRFLSSAEYRPSLDDSKMFDETPMGVMNRSEFGIFRNRRNWFEMHPLRYLDLRDKTNAPICSFGGLINSREADWF